MQRFIFLSIALLSGVPKAAAALPSSPLLCPGTATRITAHRARLDSDRPENSLSEMRVTAAVAPYMLEIDLSLTADGHIMLLHDASVDRTTDGHGAIAALDHRTVAGLHVRGQRRDGIPEFPHVASWAEHSPGVRLMLDIKQVPPAAVAPIVRKHRLAERVIVLTFDRATAAAAMAADRDWLVSVLARDEAELEAYRQMAGGRRFAAYLPAFAPPALFTAARSIGAVVVADAMTGGDGGSTDASGAYRAYLTERPADILVTDHARRLAACF